LNKIKRILLLGLTCALVLNIAACGSSKSTSTVTPTASTAPAENTPESSDSTVVNENILVVYFSWSGNLDKMSEWIADEAGAERIRIETVEPYSDEYNQTADRAKNELDNGIRPELTLTLTQEDLDQYDEIFIGFPVWWYDLPMPMWTFLESYDFTGKTIIPFFSHEGSSNGASSLSTLTKLATGATVQADNALSIRGGKVADSEQTVREWARQFI
jgi:flavodoxin